MKGLSEFLNNNLTCQQNGKLLIANDFTIPGYWAALSAYCKHNKIEFNQLDFCSERTRDYACAIALEHALSKTDGYLYQRRNSGTNYSELVLLNSADDTDKATATINSCVRQIFGCHELSDFVKDLCDVIGDLHDNVWSHGKSTGFSMAQKWENYNSAGCSFEFALADCGLGFLRELQRVGLDIHSDEEAIKWCIEEGHSSKKLKKIDDWSQRLPADSSGNPMPGIGKTFVNENHHMGLGLAKLIKLVNNYQGQLWLASGESRLFINENGQKSFNKNVQYWQGVALACRFNTERAKNYKNYNDDEAIASISELLRMQL